MKPSQRLPVFGVALSCAGLGLIALLLSSPRGKAEDHGSDSDSRIQRGFEIAPVNLNLEGLNPALVGLGSYIVNTEGCNDCHSAGPVTQYAKSGNPYSASREK